MFGGCGVGGWGRGRGRGFGGGAFVVRCGPLAGVRVGLEVQVRSSWGPARNRVCAGLGFSGTERASGVRIGNYWYWV